MAEQIHLPPFPRETFRSRMAEWFLPVTMRESGVVFFPVRMDRLRRLTQFLRDKDFQRQLFPNANTIQWISVSSASFTKPLPQTVFLQTVGIKKIKNQMQFVLVCADAEYLYDSKHEWVLAILNDLAYQYRNISVIQLIEQNVLYTTHGDVMKKYASLFNHVCYAPLYNEQEICHFTEYLYQYFGLTQRLSSKEWKQVYEACGGHPWLVKEVMRFLSLHTNADFELAVAHEELFRMVNVIWQGMTPLERAVIHKMYTNGQLSEEEKESSEYLRRINMVSRGTDGYYPTVKLLLDRTVKDLSRRPLSLESDGNIFCNAVPVTDLFSDKEYKVLRVLLSQRGNIVTRDVLGQTVWGRAEFSDWALDRLVARVRKKLFRLGYGPQFLATHPGKGFSLNSV